MNKYLLLGGAGVAAGLTYALRGKPAKRNQSQVSSNPDGTALDDSGTTNETAVQIIRALKDNAFEGSDEKLAIALGRPANEIRSWLDGSLLVDSDGLIKARGLAEERNVNIAHEPEGISS